jgi:hypothetical protein
VYLKFTIYLAVIGTSQVFAETRSIAPDLPPLKILAPSRLALGAVSQATVVFKNPLSVKMENIVLTVEGDGLLTEDIENVVGTIDAGATFSHTFDIVGMELGKQELVAGLDSSQVELVAGVTEVVVDEGVEETDPPTLPEAVKVTSVERNISVNKRVSLYTCCIQFPQAKSLEGLHELKIAFALLVAFSPSSCRSTTPMPMIWRDWF